MFESHRILRNEGKWSGLVSRAICGEHSQNHVIERYLDVARYLCRRQRNKISTAGFEKEEQSVREKLAEKGFDVDEYVVFVPGARWETKEWPPKHYAALADKIVGEGMYIVWQEALTKEKKLLWLRLRPKLIESLILPDRLLEGTGCFDQRLQSVYQRRYWPIAFAASLEKATGSQCTGQPKRSVQALMALII